MERIKPTFVNIFLSLTIFCLIAGFAIATAHKYTEGPVAASKAAAFQNAVRNVTPEYDNNPIEEQFKVATSEGDSLTVFPVRKNDTSVGYAVESFSKNGFSGLIRVMAGFDAEGKLYNYSVLEHNETPGLGSKMEAWFRQDKNRQNIIGRDMTKGMLKVVKDGGDVDAITAATISARAFLEAINIAYNAYHGSADAESSATNTDENNNTTNTDSE
jgi:electron transport complex protein RnfG